MQREHSSIVFLSLVAKLHQSATLFLVRVPFSSSVNFDCSTSLTPYVCDGNVIFEDIVLRVDAFRLNIFALRSSMWCRSLNCVLPSRELHMVL